MKKGDMIEVDYVGRVKSTGEVFDLTTEEKMDPKEKISKEIELKPMKILIGYNYVIEGLEDALKNMNVGEEIEIDIPPKKAFGKRDLSNIRTISSRNFKKNDVSPRPGKLVKIGNSVGKIISSQSGRVKVDFNHPLAGKRLNYWIRVNKKIEKPKEKTEGILEFYFKEFDVKIEDKKAKLVLNKDESPDKDLKNEIKDQIIENVDGIENVEFVSA